MSNGSMHFQDVRKGIAEFIKLHGKFLESNASLFDWLEIIKFTEKAYQERLKAHRAAKRAAKKTRRVSSGD